MKHILPFIALCGLVLLAWIAFMRFIVPGMETDLHQKASAAIKPLNANLTVVVRGQEVEIRGIVHGPKMLTKLKELATVQTIYGASGISLGNVKVEALEEAPAPEIPEVKPKPPSGENLATTNEPIATPPTKSRATGGPDGELDPAAPPQKPVASIKIFPRDGVVIARGLLPDSAMKTKLIKTLEGSLGLTPLKADIEVNTEVETPAWGDAVVQLIPEFFSRTRRPSIQIVENTLTLKGEHYNTRERDDFTAAMQKIDLSGVSIENRAYVANPPRPSPAVRTARVPDSGNTGKPRDVRMVDDEFAALLRSSIVGFDRGQIALDKEAAAKMKTLAKAMESRSYIRLIICGQVDRGGNLEYNQRLAKLRAEGVQRSLIGHGVGPAKLSIELLDPVVPPAEPEDGSQLPRRRVEFKVQ